MPSTQGLYEVGKDRSGLTKRERQVHDMLQSTTVTQQDVATELGLSRQRIRQLVVQVLAKGYTVKARWVPRPPQT